MVMMIKRHDDGTQDAVRDDDCDVDADDEERESDYDNLMLAMTMGAMMREE